MRNLLPIVSSLAILGLIPACGSNGVNRQRPDEFAVARQAPLAVPPDYSLVPPQPGAARPQQQTAADQALEALYGGPAARSSGEAATINQASTNTAPAPGVRSDVGSPQTDVLDKGGTTRDIIAAPEGNGRDASVGGAPAPTPQN